MPRTDTPSPETRDQREEMEAGGVLQSEDRFAPTRTGPTRTGPTRTGMRLTQAQIDTYYAEGYLKVPAVFTPEEMEIPFGVLSI